MAGFVLKNTLSDNGGVTRGICKMDEYNNLTEIVETSNIVKNAEGAEADGVKLDTESLVSMNMWGLAPEFLKTLESGFQYFFEKVVPENLIKAEFLIPTFIGELLAEGRKACDLRRHHGENRGSVSASAPDHHRRIRGGRRALPDAPARGGSGDGRCT